MHADATVCGLDIVEQSKLNADILLLFQLVNACPYEVLWTRYPVLNMLACISIMASFNMPGLLLYRLLPSSRDFCLNQVVLARTGRC